METISQSLRRLAVIGLVAALAACGGGTDTAAPPSPTPSPTPPSAPAPAPIPTTTLSAAGSSGRTVSLAWTPLAGETTATLERKAGDGAYSVVADLPPGATYYVDDGLAAKTTYSYRVLAAGQVLATQEATTTDDEVPTTPAGELGADLGQGVVGAAGGRVAAADGSVAVDVPAGAFAADTEIRLQAISNTAPDGLEGGVRISVGATPAKPLALTLGYGEALRDEVGGMRLAMQRSDGSWLELPTTADTATRRLTADLQAPANAPVRPAGLQRGRASSGTVRYEVVKYLGVYLSPRQSSIPARGNATLIPYARTLMKELHCVDDLCMPSPVLVAREVPIRNDRPGYSREWLVQDVPGGSSALGKVLAFSSKLGGIYIAPQRSPTPNPVTVTFRSTHQATGRAIDLHAKVEVREPVWTGTLRGYLGAADLAFRFTVEGIWTPAADSSAEEFTVTGTQAISVVNITCTASALPASALLPPGRLTINRSVEPPTYTLDVGSTWDTVITGTCPGRGGASAPFPIPGQVQISGTTTGDGRVIEGRAMVGGIEWDWLLIEKQQ